MQSSLYVALSAQVALQNRLDTIAQNVANGTSAGYRGSEMKFNAVLSKMTDPQVSFVSSGSGVIKRSSGPSSKPAILWMWRSKGRAGCQSRPRAARPIHGTAACA